MTQGVLSAGLRGKRVSAHACPSAGLLPRLEAHSQQAAPAPAAPAASASAPTGVPLSGCLSRHFIADAAAKASPAVVNIQVQPAACSAGLFPVGSSGSGFLVDGEGTLLTNAHVVADPIAARRLGGAGAAGITVTLQDERAFPARLLASDAVSDIAVLKVDAAAALPAIRLGAPLLFFSEEGPAGFRAARGERSAAPAAQPLLGGVVLKRREPRPALMLQGRRAGCARGSGWWRWGPRCRCKTP